MILRSLSKYRDTGLLLLRILIGLSFLAHGLPKLTAGPDLWVKLGKSMAFVGVSAYPLFWGLIASLTESIGGFLLLIGFCFRPACLFLAASWILRIEGFNEFRGIISRKLRRKQVPAATS